MLKRLFFLVLALGMFLEQGAEAALKSSKEPAGEMDPAAAYNPKAAEGDIELPMPNGLKMVLRPVAVPAASGLLSDHPVEMSDGASDPDRNIYEREFQSHVAAPFRMENLPVNWQQIMTKSGATARDPFVYYFLGKYELTNGQWDAVMGTSSGERPDLPKADISWYDIQDFLRKYNEWLLANHPEALPAIDGIPGYFRLPNEVEWQYAALGGNQPRDQSGAVSGIETDAENYAIFGPRFDNPASIGSRKPNPLGIHDMGGNVSEVVHDGFRIPIIDSNNAGGRIQRLHGSEGGLIIKGGSFIAKNKEDVLPKRRNEIRMFQKGPDGTFAPFHARDTGARLILTSLNVPGPKRLSELKKEEATLKQGGARTQAGNAGRTQAPAGQMGERVRLDLTGDPVTELDKIYAVAQSEEMKSNLEQLRALLGGVNEALSRERDGNLQNAINSTVYMAEALDNVAFRCYDVANLIAQAKAQNMLTKERSEKYNSALNTHYQNLLISTNAYRLNVANIARFPGSEIDRLIQILEHQHRGKDKINEIYNGNLKTLAKHIKLFKDKGRQALSNKVIWDDIILGKKTRSVIEDIQKKERA